MEKRRVVITGLGAVTPLGNDVSKTWQNLIQGKSGIGLLTRFNPDEFKFPLHFSRISAEVKDFRLEEWGIDRKFVRRCDLFIQYAIASVKEAIDDSKINLTEENPFRIGVQMGSGVGGLSSWESQYQVFLERGPDRVSPHFIPSFIINMAGGNLSIIFGIKGPNVAPVSACASGAHAIGQALDQIRLGRADIMIAGGAEAPITPFAFSGFDQMRALSRHNQEPEKASRPFDKMRDGFVLAEGAGALILEELTHSLRRKALIYAELAGFGMSADAFHITEPSLEGQTECMRLAIEDAGMALEEVDYINAHGTATPLGDISETKAIKELFGPHSQKLCVSSTKSMTGHLLGAAGGVEAVTSILVIKQGTVPPTINLENPDPECDLDYVPNVTKKRDVRVVLSNSFGFGGTNACLVFKRFENEGL